jgi:Skp family chaperone for outer membrane proteins
MHRSPGRLRRWLVAAAVSLWLSLGGAAPAQELSTGVIVSPILTLDQERLLEGTGANARVSAEFRRRSLELAEENRQIEAELVAEELALTERRPELAPEAFRDLADAFHEKVQRLRQEQDGKEADLQRLRDVELQSFLSQILPIVAEILAERGALMVIDRRAAILSADAIDITDLAIERVNAALDAPAPSTPAPSTPAPSVTPEPEPTSDPAGPGTDDPDTASEP